MLQIISANNHNHSNQIKFKNLPHQRNPREIKKANYS